MHRNWVFRHKPGRQANSHLLRPRVLGDLLSPQNRTLQVHQSASCSSFPDRQLHLRPNKSLRNPQPSRRRRRIPKPATNEWRRMRRRTKRAISKQEITTMRMRRWGRRLNLRTTEKTRHLSMKTLSKASSPLWNLPVHAIYQLHLQPHRADFEGRCKAWGRSIRAGSLPLYHQTYGYRTDPSRCPVQPDHV